MWCMLLAAFFFFFACLFVLVFCFCPSVSCEFLDVAIEIMYIFLSLMVTKNCLNVADEAL